MELNMINPKYVLQDNLRKQIYDEGKLVFDGIRLDADRIGQPCNILFSYVKEAHVHATRSHSHDFPHLFCFFGSNPKDYAEFGAEIECGIGGEINTITKPSILYMPSGLEHGPLNFKRVDNPIIFLEVMLTPKYTRKVSK